MAVPETFPMVKVALALSTEPMFKVDSDPRLQVPPGVDVVRFLVTTPSAQIGLLSVLLSGELGEVIVVFTTSGRLSQPVSTDFTFTFLTTVPLFKSLMIILPDA